VLAEYRTPTPAVVTPQPRNDTGDDEDDEPPLNEDDDDEDEENDLTDDNDEPNTQHLVLAQFDKVIVVLLNIILTKQNLICL
jgi:transcription initiation factor TFIIA large subunit